METTDDLQAGRRRYWAQRHGTRNEKLDLPSAARLYRSVIAGLIENGYLQEWFGYYCVDADNVAGLAGDDVPAFAYRKTWLDGLWPVSDEWLGWDEEHFLTAVEFFYDHVSKPIDGRFHDWNQCGWHYNTFDREAGQQLYRREANDILIDYSEGFELEAGGNVVRVVPTGLQDLVHQPLPGEGPSNQSTLQHAIDKFRARSSTELDQLDALRHLAALLESVRPQLKTVFAHKDEADLFEVANRFNIRHANASQQGNYDRSVFLPWLFYSHVAAIHAAFELLDRQDNQ